MLIQLRKLTLHRKRGMIMAIALVLITLAAISSVLMVRTLLEHQSLNKRRRELNRAFYDAEAGIQLVVDWGNVSNHYTTNPTLFQYVAPTTTSSTSAGFVYDSGNMAQQFPNLFSAVNQGTVTISHSDLIAVTTTGGITIGNFVAAGGYSAGQVDEIQLSLPSNKIGNSAPSWATLPAGSTLDPELAIKSTGSSPDGRRRSVVAFVDINPFLKLILPAALVSWNMAAAFGNAQIHWGESWSKGTFNMLNKSQVNYLDRTDPDWDKWAKYRTEGKIQYPNNWQFKNAAPWNAPGKLYLDADNNGISEAPVTAGVGARPGLFPDGTGNYRDAFYQDVPSGALTWPDFASFYSNFKQFAQSHGRYYTTNAAGQILKNGVPVTGFKEEFIDPIDTNNDGVVSSTERDNAPYDIVFIDTTNGQPPAANGSNLATIQCTGNGAAFKGVYYMCVNFDGGGIGTPPALTNAEKPIDSDNDGFIDGGTPLGYSLDKIFLDGVMYAAGTISLSGNAGIYGSIVAQKGFTGGGTPNIYYNWRLKNGMILEQGNVGSRFHTVLTINLAEPEVAAGS